MIRILPMLALRGKMIYPGTTVHFDVSREKSAAAVQEAMQNDQTIFLCNQIDPNAEKPQPKDLYAVGLVAKVKQIVKLPQNIIRVFVEGIERASIREICETEPSFRVETETLETYRKFQPYEEKAYIDSLKNGLQAYHAQNPQLNREFIEKSLNLDDLEMLIDEIATHLPFQLEEKQDILEISDLKERAQKLLVMLSEACEIARVQREIQIKVKKAVDKNQRDYMLREQLQIIREELGETSIEEDADTFLHMTYELDASDEVKEKLVKEIQRFKGMPAMAGDSGMLRNYIETMLEMPWNRRKEERLDLKYAAKILEKDHYGLEKIKERILEFLAVRILTRKGEAPIICLVGPPGTGKTSIGRSIARALNKEYVRISLGGVRDEAEIRGHRKTYIGAMPGRIAEAIKKAGVANPLILLDEIDKTGKDQRGDTASALLEVLDGEQNKNFRDHYLEVPLDLSEVLFIATANDASTIPKPLYDRMEIIELGSYTDEEKRMIAKNHLIPKQLKQHGLKKQQLRITDDATREIITCYTQESGVRNLERSIGEICRKAAMQLVSQEDAKRIQVTATNLETFLGVRKFLPDRLPCNDQVGLVTGLAWTSVGGETLEVEVNVMDGSGKLELTGNLGDVMKESAQAALSYIRANALTLGVAPDFYKTKDIHVHFPEGAVPKDGPSAGVTVCTAIVSALTGAKVRRDVAMTGEISLRGRVMRIGGLKEKTMAALRHGIRTVIIPKDNERDLEEIDQMVRRQLNFISAQTVDTVLEAALIRQSEVLQPVLAGIPGDVKPKNRKPELRQ